MRWRGIRKESFPPTSHHTFFDGGGRGRRQGPAVDAGLGLGGLGRDASGRQEGQQGNGRVGQGRGPGSPPYCQMVAGRARAGIPGRLTYRMMQDDLIFNMSKAAGRGLSAADNPSVVTRVYLPPFAQWERRDGASFGFRCGCTTHAIITGKEHPDRGDFGVEEYWPGMFICFVPGDGKEKSDS